MTTQRESRRIGRRTFLMGAAGGAAAAAAAVTVGCDSIEEAKAVDWQGRVAARFVSNDLPARDPSSSLWGEATRFMVPLTSQMSTMPFRTTPSTPSIVVRSLYNKKQIAFLLEWDDARPHESVVKTLEFRDGCAVLTGPADVDAAFYMMGMPDAPAGILYWRADWQKDIDEGFQDLESAFPNAAFDFYPPLVDAEHPLKIDDNYPSEGRAWLTGWSAGNPLSQPIKTTPVEKLVGRGPGTIDHLPVQDAEGKGVWENGHWKVVLARTLDASNEEETALKAGNEYALVFTVWSGAEQDRGSRKSPSAMGKLFLEPA